MRLIAGGPPVDAPMAMSRGGAGPSLRDAGAGTGTGGGAKVPDMVPDGARARRAVGEVTMRSCVTSRTLASSSSWMLRSSGVIVPRRLGHEVERAQLERLEHVLARRVAGDDDAPASAAAPSGGAGRRSRPSCGISRSSVMTSGCELKGHASAPLRRRRRGPRPESRARPRAWR